MNNNFDITSQMREFKVTKDEITEAISEVYATLPESKVSEMKLMCSRDEAFTLSLEQLVVTLSGLISYAKTFERNDDFNNALMALIDFDFNMNKGLLREFGGAMVLCDMTHSNYDGDEFLLDKAVESNVIQERLQNLISKIITPL